MRNLPKGCLPRGPAPMLPPRKRFVTPPHPEGRLQRHIKTPNFAAGPAQSRWESAFPRPFAACGCVSDAYTTHCPLLWGHVHTLSMFFSKNLRKIFHFSGFSRCFPHLSRRGFQVFSCFLSFSPFFSRFLALQKSRAKRRARGRRARAREAEMPAELSVHPAAPRKKPRRARAREAEMPVELPAHPAAPRKRRHRARAREAEMPEELPAHPAAPRKRPRRARAREAEIPANCLRTGPHRAKDRAARVPVRRKCRWNCLRTRLHRAKSRAARVPLRRKHRASGPGCQPPRPAPCARKQPLSCEQMTPTACR